MTVTQLIKKLEKIPGKYHVYFVEDDEGRFVPLDPFVDEDAADGIAILREDSGEDYDE